MQGDVLSTRGLQPEVEREAETPRRVERHRGAAELARWGDVSSSSQLPFAAPTVSNLTNVL